MQRKSFIISLLYFCFGFFSINAQNAELKELKVKEFQSDAFVNFKDIMEDHTVFMIGEDYEKELKNDIFEMSLIEFLHREEGIRGLLFERGIAEMYFINEYINGGSEKFLEIQESHFRESDLKFFSKLRNYNDSNKTEKLQVMGVTKDAHPEMEILYLDELLGSANTFTPRINNIKQAAKKIYSEYNFIEKLLEKGEFASVTSEKLDYNDLINQMVVMDISNLTTDQNTIDRFEAFVANKKSIYHQIKEGRKNTSIAIPNYQSIILTNFRLFQKLYPNRKYYAHFPWCNVERESNQRNCEAYAYSVFLQQKKALNIFTVISLQTMPHSFANRMVQFNPQIKYAAENNFDYSGFLATKDSLLDYVILTKSTLSKSRKEIYFEEINNSNYISFYLNYGLIGYVNNDIEALNTSIKNSFAGFSEFKTELGHRFLDLAIDKSGYVIKVSHKWTNEDPVLLSNRESVEFNQKSTTGYLGYNLLKHKRNMIAPMVGIGYANSTLEYMETTQINNPPFTQFETKNYSNPGFIMDYMVDINFATKTYVGFGFNIGYVLDLSNQTWLLDGETVSTTPKFSNSGFHAGFSVLINFNKNL